MASVCECLGISPFGSASVPATDVGKADVAREAGSLVMDVLARELGGNERATTLVLTPGRRLARTTATEVLRAIREQGYYLQMPPLPETLRVQGRDATS